MVVAVGLGTGIKPFYAPNLTFGPAMIHQVYSCFECMKTSSVTLSHKPSNCRIILCWYIQKKAS